MYRAQHLYRARHLLFSRPICGSVGPSIYHLTDLTPDLSGPPPPPPTLGVFFFFFVGCWQAGGWLIGLLLLAGYSLTGWGCLQAGCGARGWLNASGCLLLVVGWLLAASCWLVVG